jgi:hypothetical protein
MLVQEQWRIGWFGCCCWWQQRGRCLRKVVCETDFDSNVGGGEEKEGKCMFGNSCGVYWGRDVVGLLPVVQLVNKFEFDRFFGVESCVANFWMVWKGRGTWGYDDW